jgi:hypothetical protein
MVESTGKYSDMEGWICTWHEKKLITSEQRCVPWMSECSLSNVEWHNSPHLATSYLQERETLDPLGKSLKPPGRLISFILRDSSRPQKTILSDI